MSNTDGPVARFLRGECADAFAVSALTNEEFGVLFGLMHKDDQVSSIPETEEPATEDLGDLLESSSDDKPVRRSKSVSHVSLQKFEQRLSLPLGAFEPHLRRSHRQLLLVALQFLRHVA